MTEFVAVDGEAIDDRYRLLCSSEGRHVYSDAGALSTVDCLEFLLGHAAKGRTLVCFGLGYDANNWLCDLSPAYLKELWAEQTVCWGLYRLEWLPGRWLAVKHIDGRYVKVCETFGFFQTSFVRALADWGYTPPAALAEMKAARGTFTAAQLAKIVAYCHDECRLLVALMDDLAAACAVAGVTPKSWIGAGAMAAALLQARGVREHHRHDLDIAEPDVANEAILGAYFAGRIELLHQGVHTNVAGLDIRSAYPAAATHLPSLDGAQLVARKRYDPAAPHALWRCSWANLPGLVMPFPTRHNGAILYPRTGSGIYHAAEVAAARACFGPAIRIDGGWVLKVCRPEKPFGWVPELFAQRAAWQRAGNPAQKPLKLGLNSLYGKLAQGYGYGGRTPAWQSYMWAGEITARTRARMLTAAHGARQPMMLATDGVYCQTAKVKPTARKVLGSWEGQRIDWLFCAQAGVYEAIHDGLSVVKSRGFFAREVDYEQLREEWQRDGAQATYTYRSTRFIGLGTALARNRLDLWNTWATDPRTLTLMPARKIALPDGTLAPIGGPVTSEPYEPKISLVDAKVLENVQGSEQPLRDDV